MADTKQGNVADVFADLAITPSDEPLPEPVRGGADSGPNPFTEPLLASVEHSKPYNFYVPAPAVQRAVFLINAAARKANKGVRIVVNVQRDDKGHVVKGADGKAVPIAEKDGPNKGKVLIRFQGKAERKQQTAPRPYSLLKDKTDATGNTWIVRRRTDKQAMFKGKREDAKAQYKALTEAFRNTPPEAVSTPADTTQQSATPAAQPAA
jgi:hypothetical protein